MPLPAGTRVGPYEVAAQLGAGGMGEVYRARDTQLGRDVAIKVLPDAFAQDPDRLARFEREARTLAALNHPNIAAIYGLEKSDGLHALVMELADGPTLADVILGKAGTSGPAGLSPDEALPMARQIADALAAAHEQGIIHRDLKPANIAITANGDVKVLDFGLAKAVGAGTGSSTPAATQSPTLSLAATRAGTILGTAAYMAPEQAKGRDADKRSDVWAFGCVLYEMLTGARAFEGEDASDTLAAVLRAEPDWTRLPQGVSDQIRLLLTRCLEKDRKARLSDMSVARFLLTETIPSRGETTIPLPPARSRRVALFSIGVAALAAAVAGTAWLTVRLTSHVDRSARFEIVPPLTAPLTSAGGQRDIAISPDGTRIVFLARIGNTPQVQLMTRTIDRLEATRLDGTVNGLSPFFSPDGQWVGFFTTAIGGGEIKKVPVNGGAPVTLCRFTDGPRGASWGDDGTIVFATSATSTGLMRVSSDGGEPTMLTKPDSAVADHRFPFVLPGSRAVLFSVGTGGATPLTAALDGATGRVTTVLHGGGAPQLIGSKYLVYSAGSTVRVVRFDASAMQVVGDSVPLEQAASVSSVANFAVSRNGTLVFAPGGVATAAQRQLVWVNRQGVEEPITSTPPRPFADPRISPDGQRLAVEISDETQDIWTIDLARGALQRQTFEDLEDETPEWSPDGLWLAYSSTRASQRTVFRRRADGSGPEEPLWSGADHSHVDGWTRDGQLLLTITSESQGTNILLLQRDGTTKPLAQTRFDENNAALSGDDRWLAYVSNESGRPEVYVAAFPSMQGKTIVSIGGGSQPRWSATGELFYQTKGAIVAARVLPGASFSLGPEQKIYTGTYHAKGTLHTPYDISARADRVLIVKEQRSPESSAAAQPGLVVVLNWLEELKARLP